MNIPNFLYPIMPATPGIYVIFLLPLPKNRFCRTYRSHVASPGLKGTLTRVNDPIDRIHIPLRGQTAWSPWTDCITTTGNDWPECSHLVADWRLNVKDNITEKLVVATWISHYYQVLFFLAGCLESFDDNIPGQNAPIQSKFIEGYITTIIIKFHLCYPVSRWSSFRLTVWDQHHIKVERNLYPHMGLFSKWDFWIFWVQITLNKSSIN